MPVNFANKKFITNIDFVAEFRKEISSMGHQQEKACFMAFNLKNTKRFRWKNWHKARKNRMCQELKKLEG